MRRAGKVIVGALVLGVVMAGPGPLWARQIERACRQSDRSAATPQLCACIQRVADQVLTGPDQRLVARFFRDPEHAEDIRRSDSNAHERFWERYRAFGTTATRVCG